MAFNRKYKIESTSDVFGEIVLYILQNNYTGDIIELEGVGRNWITLNIGGNTKDITDVILSSNLQFDFYVKEDFQTIEFGDSQPYSFLVELGIPQGQGLEIIWKGWIKPEEYYETYTNTPYVASVTATDGLEELKSIKYENIPGSGLLFDQLVKCLTETKIDLFIYESINLYDVSMATLNSSSPLLQASVDNTSYFEISEDVTYYDVLVAILRPFFSRIYQYKGWRIENIDGKKASYRERVYNFNGASFGNSLINPLVELDNNPTNFKAFIGKTGELEFKPSINNCEVYFNTSTPDQLDLIKGFSLLSDWVDENNLVDWVKLGGIPLQRGIINFDNFEYTAKIVGKVSNVGNERLASKFIPIDKNGFESITIGFKYWMNYPSIILFGSKPTLFMTITLLDTVTNTAYWYNNGWGTTEKYIRIDANGRQLFRDWQTTIDEIPVSGNLRITFHQLVKKGDVGNTELRLTGFFTEIQTGEKSNDLILKEVGTSSIFTDYEGASFQHYVSDGAVVGRQGVMDVFGILTSSWSRRGKTDNLNIRRLFLLQWLSMLQKPTAILSGEILTKGEKITPISVIKDKDAVRNTRYIMASYSMSLSSGFGSIKYIELPLNDVSVTYIEESVDPTLVRNLYPDFRPLGSISPLRAPRRSSSTTGSRTNFVLNGDATGDVNSVSLTPSAIVNKEVLDITPLESSRVVINAVEDVEDNEVMSKTSVLDIFTKWDEKTTAVNDDSLTLSDSEDNGELKIITVGNLLKEYVPYTGADKNVDLGEFGLKAGYLALDTTPTNTPTEQGTMYWDVDDNTVAMIMNGTIQKIGEDAFYPVKNQTGSNIPKGTAVRFAGTVGSSGRLLIAPFIADGSFPSITFMGVTSEDIANGEDGKVQWFGRIKGINTNAFNEGDILYASPTVAGGFTTTPPQAPNNIISVFAVITKSTTVGTIFVRPQIGSNINNDEGVKIVSPLTGNLLQFQSNGLWENKTLAQVLGGTGSQFVKGNGTLDSNVYQLVSEKGQPNGYASLDGGGKVPANQLPSFVDDVLEFPSLGDFPTTGETGKIYVALDTNKTYRWSGSAYVEISPSDVNSVFGRTGVVTAQAGDYNSFYVRHDINNQGLNATQQLNARTNIGAGTSSLILGETSTTAYRGDRGKIAYDYSQISHLPLTGGTMTGNINYAQTDRGLTWGFNTDGAYIKFFNTGDADTNSRLEFGTSDNNNEFFRWVHTSLGVTYENMRLMPVSNGNSELIINGKFIKQGGTTEQFLKANGDIDSTAYYPSSNPNGYTTNTGTVTSVASLTIGTTGTDITSTVATGTTTPVITLNVPTASATNRGALSSTDWTAFNNKLSGTIGAGQVAFGTGAGVVGGDSGLVWDNVNKRLGIGTTTPSTRLSFGIADIIAEIGRIGFDVGTNQRSFISANRTVAVGQLSTLSFGTSGSERVTIGVSGEVTVNNLAGTGSGIVGADASGNLIRYTIGSGLTLTGTTLTASGGSTTGLTGSGTANIISMWSGATSLTNSVLSQGASDARILAENSINGTARLAVVNTNTGTSAVAFNFATTTGNRYLGFLVGGANRTGTTAGLSNASLSELQSGGDSSAMLIHAAGNYPMAFAINFNEAMRIASNGNVGIGTTSPSAKLQVNGNINIATVANATGDFLTHVNGLVNKRTATQVRTDISAIGKEANVNTPSTTQADRLWVGTLADYNAITTKSNEVIYYIL